MTNYETRPEDRHATRGAEPRRGTPPAPGPEQPTASFGATAATTTREDERYEEQRYGDERYGDEYGQRYRARREEHEDYEEPRSRRSVMGLVSGLAQDAVRLVRQEAELAKAEMSEKVDQARNGLVELGAGAAIAYAGFLVLLASATFALANVVDAWVAALIVGGAVLLIGLAMLASAKKNLRARNLTPRKTADSLREDAELVRHEARRMRP